MINIKVIKIFADFITPPKSLKRDYTTNKIKSEFITLIASNSQSRF